MLQKLIINFLCIFLFITQCSVTHTCDHKEIDDEHFMLFDENDDDNYFEWQKCDENEKDFHEPHGIKKYVDFDLLKKFFNNLIPISMPKNLEMRFYLFRREFPDCGREIRLDDQTVFTADLDPKRPTRILVHGWMSRLHGSFNHDVKNAYLTKGDFNVIICDWTVNSTHYNYVSVTKMVDGFGVQLAGLAKHLHHSLQVNYDDIYLIGHSLGAHIAGAAGKWIKPDQFNTIFALDPAGPLFRLKPKDERIDPTDAKYVESIQTSALYGLIKPQGNATFYPNYGFRQPDCVISKCSHTRAYQLFAESLTTHLGFYGIRCNTLERFVRECDETGEKVFRMGGDPAVKKNGTFYVKTADSSPFALGKVW